MAPTPAGHQLPGWGDPEPRRAQGSGVQRLGKRRRLFQRESRKASSSRAFSTQLTSPSTPALSPEVPRSYEHAQDLFKAGESLTSVPPARKNHSSAVRPAGPSAWGRQHGFLAMRKLRLDIQIKGPGSVFQHFYTPFRFISSQKSFTNGRLTPIPPLNTTDKKIVQR